MKQNPLWHVFESEWLHIKIFEAACIFVDEIPRNPSGNILRRMIREHAKKSQYKRAKL